MNVPKERKGRRLKRLRGLSGVASTAESKDTLQVIAPCPDRRRLATTAVRMVISQRIAKHRNSLDEVINKGEVMGSEGERNLKGGNTSFVYLSCIQNFLS